MKVIEIYDYFCIPIHLQLHMLRVASVAWYVGKHWRGEFDRQRVVEAGLLHDLGNLLKFDLDQRLDLFDNNDRDIEYWKQKKLEMAEKYGENENLATLAMAREIGVDKCVVSLLENMGSSNFEKVLKSNHWELKVVTYSDFRVDPHGFVSVEERFDEIFKRYEGRDHPLANKVVTLMRRNYCLELEEELQKKVSVPLGNLPADELASRIEELKDFDIELKTNRS